MDKTRTSINGRLLLLFLSGMLFAGCAVGRKQCVVDNTTVTSYSGDSTFVFNFTYKDPSCTNKENLQVKLMSCNGDSRYAPLEAKHEGETYRCWYEGEWKVTVSQNGGSEADVESTCFECIGLVMSNTYRYDFNHQELRVEFQKVHPKVTSWNVSVYEHNTTVKTDYTRFCKKYTQVRLIEKKFGKLDLQPQNISRNHITLKHDFNKDACYCFVLEPISDLNLRPPEVFTNERCIPHPYISTEGGSSNPNLPPTKIPFVLLIMIPAVVMLVVALCKPQFLSRILGLLKGTAKKESPPQKSLLSQYTHVLLLHAPDVSASKHLATLKKQLQADFKVHDLYDCYDHKRLADHCGWMEEMLMPGSGVKLLLVESVGLVDLIDSLLKSYPENPGKAKMTQISPQTQTADSLLTFALSTIICTNLREDYSTVFVVRFTDEVRNVADLLVQMRRYKFPDHFPELAEAIKRANCNSKEKEFI